MRFSLKKTAIVLHDAVMTAIAVVASILLRFDDAQLAERLAVLKQVLPSFVIYAAIVYVFFGL